jgi:methyltransferase (TIGR00027 family)
VPVDLRHDWRAALEQAGFDPERPTAWLAEGIFEYLRPQAQDSLLDNITAASADGSQLVAVINMTAPGSGTVLKPAIQKLYEHGLDVKLENLSYFGERNEVAPYLDSCGWHSVGTPAIQLFADNGLPVPAKDNHYLYISTLHKTTN